MRNNQPITQREFVFDDRATLMSTTDLNSHITYANDAFIEVSGFTPEEVDGQPHNMVRHPDMPPEAFADMWSTLKQGEPDRAGQEPAQEWRSLLGARQCHSGGARGQAAGLYVGTHQTVGGGGPSVRGAVP